MEFSESDCCGNGCANCVLNYNNNLKNNSKMLLEQEISSKTNVLNKFSYFHLIRKKLHIPKCNTLIELHYKSLEKDNNDKYTLHLKPGQHVMMRVCYSAITSPNVTDCKIEGYVLRPYSPYWWDAKSLEFKILIKLQSEGIMSKYLNAAYEQSHVQFRAFPTIYHHEVDTKGTTYKMFITQGVAVASVLPIIRHIIHNEDDMTRIVHLLCFTNINFICFRDKLEEYNKYWNYKSIIFLSRQCCENPLCLELGRCRQDCMTFKQQLRYKDAIHPYRLNSDTLKHLFSLHMSKDMNDNYIVLAGSRSFQNHYQILFNSGDYNIIDKNIFIL